MGSLGAGCVWPPCHTERKGAPLPQLLFPRAALRPGVWSESGEAASSGVELWSTRLLQTCVFILMQPLTCSSLLSPTPPRPGSALRCSGTGLLLSCHSLFRTESQSVGPTDTFRSSSTNAGSAGAEIPAQEEGTRRNTRGQNLGGWGDATFPFPPQTQPFFHPHLVKRSGKVKYDLQFTNLVFRDREYFKWRQR